MKKISGSFRDPSATVFELNDKIIRAIYKSGEKKFHHLISTRILEESVEKDFLIDTEVFKNENLKKNLNCSFMLEHKKVPYVSYPYEWNFEQLRDAALHHLRFNIFLIEKNFQLIDASSYNIQFIGNRTTFIDAFSVDNYIEGSNWDGHNQFCQQFLNPLLLTSSKGIFYNDLYHGNLEGIKNVDICKILSLFQKMSPTIFFNVVLPAYFENKNKLKNIDNLKLINDKKKNFNKKSYLWLLKNLKNFISKLKSPKEISFWKNYNKVNTYNAEQFEIKKKIIRNFILKNKPKILCDMGCNDGEFSEISLKNGCEYVVGFDNDQSSLIESYSRAKEKNLDFLPLYFDASKPSANIGWYQSERLGFLERCKFDALLALAFEHHLAIAKNIPLDELINWFLNIAPIGLIEFIPKEDSTIQIMLKFRKDIFLEYNEENFKNILQKKAKILNIYEIDKTKRKIYEYEKYS